MLLPAIAAGVLAANPYLDEGATLFDRMLYEKAVTKLKRATEVSSSTTAERRRAHDLLARSYAALGQNDQASRTFIALLSVDPLAPLPADVSPTIRRLFLEAKEGLYPKGKAQLRRIAAPAPRVTVELVDPWEIVARVELRQQSHEGPLPPVSVDASGLINVEASPEATRCTVVALSSRGETVGSLGPIVFEASARLTPAPAPEPAPTAAPAPAVTVTEEPPLPATATRWPVIIAGATTLALLATGAALSVAAAAESSSVLQQNTYASDVRAADNSAIAKGITGAVFLGAAGVGVAATAVIYFKW